MAVALGIIEKVAQPYEVKVIFQGRYLRYEDRQALDAARELTALSRNEREVTQKEICLALLFHGWDGIYTRAGFSTVNELVIMNAPRISRFGDWERP
jgi:hypothetical protein